MAKILDCGSICTHDRKLGINHKNIAYESGAKKTGLYSLMDKIIRTGSKIAITISEKI